MNRFIVFAGALYYPEGGAKDIISRHADRAEALAAMQAAVAGEGAHCWAHVLDVDSGEVVNETHAEWVRESRGEQ